MSFPQMAVAGRLSQTTVLVLGRALFHQVFTSIINTSNSGANPTTYILTSCYRASGGDVRASRAERERENSLRS